MIEIKHVTKTFGSKTAVDHIDLNIPAGEIVGFIGPNGAGKTTISRIASARLFPSKGTVDVLDERMGRVDISELHPRIGLTSSALAQNVLGGETAMSVVLSASYGRIGVWTEQYDDFDVERAHALLDALGAGSIAERTWANLSSGERKRVEIARALMPDPELLILDEPASGLDVAGREQLLAALTEIISAPGSPSMLLVTHHLEEIPVGFTHALALRDGRVVGEGALDDVLTDATMSETFGIPLEITKDRGRYAARGRGALTGSGHAA